MAGNKMARVPPFLMPRNKNFGTIKARKWQQQRKNWMIYAN